VKRNSVTNRMDIEEVSRFRNVTEKSVLRLKNVQETQ